MSRNKDAVQKNILQAVVIGDHFGNDFSPTTDDTPFMFLPVCNFPMIEYTIQTLFYSNVEEIFLVCTSHVELIEEYINMCYDKLVHWTVEIKVHVIRSNSSSIGDCLRHLHSNDLIRGNFILMEAGSIGTIKLNVAMKKHEYFCKKDKSAAMTLVFQQIPLGAIQEKLMVISSPAQKLLFYNKNDVSPAKIPLEIFNENDYVDILEDLRDTRIAICSPTVLSLFADNFDFQTRDDFVKDLLVNEEISDGTIYCYQGTDKEWGACIKNWRTYQRVSYDIMERWSYPLVPFEMHSAKSPGINYRISKLYEKAILHKDSKVSKGDAIKGNVILGANSVVHDGARIVDSVVGDNVIIGNHVVLDNCYIFSNTVIHGSCSVTSSVVGSNCVLNSDCHIINGSVIGNGVQLPNKTTVDNELVSATESEDYETLKKLSGLAFVIKCVDEEEPIDTRTRLKLKNEVVVSDNEVFDEYDELDDDLSHGETSEHEEESNTNVFLSEVFDSLERGFVEKLQCPNLVLEINSSRYVHNVSNEEVNCNVVKAILTLPFQLDPGLPYWPSLQRLLEYFSYILTNYIKNNSSMQDCLEAIEDVASTHSEMIPATAQVLLYLYNKDFLSEEAITKWFENVDVKSDLYKKVSPFIEWLKEAEEESSEED